MNVVTVPGWIPDPQMTASARLSHRTFRGAIVVRRPDLDVVLGQTKLGLEVGGTDDQIASLGE